MNDSKKLRKLRIDNDLTQTDLSQILGVSQQFISKIEKGKSKISNNIKVLLTKAFDKDCN